MMDRTDRFRMPLVLGVTLLLALAVFAGFIPLGAAADTAPIRPLNPNEQRLGDEQVEAQDLALNSAEVIDLIDGHRAEVFEVFPLFGPYAPGLGQCIDGTCYQVDIYDFEQLAAVTAIVHQRSGEVLDVFRIADSTPLINKRLHDRAVEIIQTDADVAAALGFSPRSDQIRLMHINRMDTECQGGRLCAGAVFFVDSGALWVAVDLVDDDIEKIWWSGRPAALQSNVFDPKPEREPEDCGTTISVDRDGWKLDYRTTPTDALEITSVTYDAGGGDVAVATRMKLIEWHAHYPPSWGFVDYTGCGGGGGGFPIYPFGVTQVLDLYENLDYTGFEVVQDFRMSNWGASCNYRYEQHFQFFTDGRFRVVTVVFGQGCGNNQLEEATYRPVVRIDIAVDGDPNDSIQVWDGNDWQTQASEAWWLQSGPYTPEGYRYRVMDASGTGFFIEPGQGQFDDSGTGDNAYTYVTQHKESEGDGDMPQQGSCCNADHRQGPEQFINGESVDDDNIVLWYVPQSETITTWQVDQGLADAQYCWTDNTSTTWPCFSGPMFVPVNACSAYDLNCDGIIDTGDITEVASHWNCRILSSTCYVPEYDFNNDWVIDIQDAMRVSGRWGCVQGQPCYN
ncbi:MAG: hypothetical protein U9R25_10435 [Chloroflexota bacterium]|nr:hypothetical protein [Chloroflexota bacterium]